jgi:hypothetical protein
MVELRVDFALGKRVKGGGRLVQDDEGIVAFSSLCYISVMTLQQTVTIPDSRELRLNFRLPQAIPAGRAKVEIIIIPEIQPQAVEEAWVNPLLGLCEDSSLTVDRFLEMKREEIALEEANDERLWSNR